MVEKNREYNILKKYGLTLEDFECLRLAFRNRCGICSVEFTEIKPTFGQVSTAPVVDHDHSTNRVRGLLCGNCNKGLGCFKDNQEFLTKAVEWVSD